MLRRMLPRLTLLISVASVAVLAGCAPAVNLNAAPDAANPECAELIVRLPDAVADQPIRETNAQATGAWGDPATVLLRCGVPPLGPTTQRCYNVNGIDWIEDESKAPTYVFTTFGRTPATEVVVDSNKVSGATVLVDLASAVSVIPQAHGKCTSVQDLEVPLP